MDTKYSGSDSFASVCWCYDSDPVYDTHEVALKAPNELGTYDMSGNLLEWCNDWFEDYTAAPQTNPVGAVTGEYRVLRGGAFYDYATKCRVSARLSEEPVRSFGGFGFRCVRTRP